jgi:hypothetical protein
MLLKIMLVFTILRNRGRSRQTRWGTRPMHAATQAWRGVGGMTRPTIYRHLREYVEYVKTGQVRQVSRGLWRVRTAEEPSP